MESNELSHESHGSQLVAGIYHIGFAALYLIALVWHLRGAGQHFQAAEKVVDKHLDLQLNSVRGERNV